MTIWSKTGSSAWTKINSLFVKTGSTTWTEMLGAWVKTGSTTWTRVFTRILVPANTVLPDITGSTKLYGTLTGSLGSWTSPNGTNSYARQWQRASNSGGVAGAFSAISGATSSTYTTTDSDDNKFVCLRVTATNLSGPTTAQSYEYLITKYTPVALSIYSLSGSSIVGGTLTALEQIGTWKGTTTITGDTSPSTFEYEWSWSDGTVRQSTAFNSTNSNTYTIVSGDLGKIIRVAVTGTNSGGSATSGYTSSGTVTSTYTFNFGNTLYVGSNGYIGLDNGGSTAGSAGAGRNISIWNQDLVQYSLQEYSDSSNYHLFFKSYRYQSPLVQTAANALDYQIKFYTNQPYCDVYLVRVGSSVPIYSTSPGYYSNGLSGGTGVPGPFVWGVGSVLRVYFNGTLGSFSAGSPWSAISAGLWKNITTSQIDDSFTSVVTSANQSAPFPSNTSLPTLTTNTGNFSVGSVITINAGTWSNTNSYTYELLYGTATPVSDTSTSTKTLVNTNQYTISDGDAASPSYYFRGRVTGFAESGQIGNSTIALSSTSGRATFSPTTTISVGTATSSGFTISGTAGPLSGFSTTRVDITSIQIFNSSQSLVTTITTSLPVVNGTTGAWSYIWSGGDASTTYYAKATVTARDSSQTTFTSGFSSSIETSAAVTLYTVTFNVNGATGAPSVNSVVQSTQGGLVTLATKGTMGGGSNRIFGGWRTGTTSGTVYAFGASFTPTSNTTLYAYYGTQPTCVAPSITFRRFPTNTSTSWEYFGDYPTPSGAYTEIIGMQYEVYSANSTSGSTVTGGAGTLAYPTGYLYPYTSTRDSTSWSFLIRSGQGGRTTAAVGTRFSRFRVRMRGIDGVDYPGTFTSPLF
jgi:hypothetical protein